jgi:hypothetical protein
MEAEVKELVRMAEEEDGKGLEPGLKIPEEILRREKRQAALKSAKAAMEKMYEEAKQSGEPLAKLTSNKEL